MKKMIQEFEICELGPEHPDYFQGFGVSFTPFTDCAVGTGDTCTEAIDDAWEQLAQVYDNVDELAKQSAKPEEGFSILDEYGEDSEFRYYVGIRVK